MTQNDSQGHSGPNNFQDFPALASAVSASTDTSITGNFSSGALSGQSFEPNIVITLDFYADGSPDPSGHGQGQTYLGSAQVLTDPSGNVTFSVDLATGNPANEWLTATATGPDGSTSEFSADVPILVPNETFAQFLQTVLPQNSTTANSLTIAASATATPATVIQAVNGLTGVTQPVTVVLDLGGARTQREAPLLARLTRPRRPTWDLSCRTARSTRPSACRTAAARRCSTRRRRPR